MIIVLYTSTSGSTELVAEEIQRCLAPPVTVLNLRSLEADPDPSLLGANLVFAGTPTYGRGDWHLFWKKKLSLTLPILASAVRVALFGVGDARFHGQTFCGGIGKLYDAVIPHGVQPIGSTPADKYGYEGTAALRSGAFPGFIIDYKQDRRDARKQIIGWLGAIGALQPTVSLGEQHSREMFDQSPHVTSLGGTGSYERDGVEFPAESNDAAVSPIVRFLPLLEAAEEASLLAVGFGRSFAADEIVFDQNVRSRAMFFIEEGSVRIERQHRDAMVPLALLGTGELFGEMSFLDGAPTSARVTADEPTRVRIIDLEAIRKLTKMDPGLAGRLYQSVAATLAERLRLTSMRVRGDELWD